MVQYRTIRQALRSDEIGTYMAFGICVQNGASDSCCIPDVFLHEQEAKDFVARLNELQLSPIHLMDAIEDALNA